ncbi:MAG TPA: YbhB/YbcL family Raf kinase inhibitor-like protein [Dehalococcoidia bacterium]|nr:YbhB/YbcL family Raf kinase inhibitor-like protein [Dehalococcoidia bacterium]
MTRSGLIWYNCSATKVDVNEPVTVQVHIADIIMEYDGEGFPEYLYGVDNIPEGFTWAYQWISPGEDEQPVIIVRETVWEQSTMVHPIDEEMEFTDSIELQFDRAGTVVIRLQQPDDLAPPILFEVLDTQGSGPCTITVGGPPNNPPIFDDIEDQSVIAEHLLEFAVSATDLDGDELTYSASLLPDGGLPIGAVFDNGNGSFSWTPSYLRAGTYHVRFVVDDGNDTDYQDMTITVIPLEICWNTLWQIGDVEEDQMADPQDELDLSAPVGTQNFYVGDPYDQFPALSQYEQNIAPTINIHFTGGMPLGGRLLFSWSPGASGVEIMTISLDGTVLDTLEREGSPDEGWWQSYERFIETFYIIDELDDSEHILTFEFSGGNGAVWDWIRFEEWTCQGVRSSYNLTVSSSTGGSVVEPGEGFFTYGRDERVDLVAEADEGYQFDRWEGLVAVAGTTLPATTTVRMNEDKTVTAYFSLIPPFELTSSALELENGDLIPPIPTKYAHYWAGGSNISPPLEWTGVPEDTQSFVLIMEDPEGWSGIPCVHWIVFNIPANVTSLAEGASSHLPEGAVHGIGSDGDVGYYGCEPPPGELHYYHFTIYALDTMLTLPQGATKSQVIAAMEGHKLGESTLVGTYQG